MLVAVGCSATKDESGLKMEDLVGEWENTSLEVKMNTFQNRDTTSYLSAPEGKWEEVLKIQPIRTVYEADSTYTSLYKDLEGNPLGENKGTWFVRNDSLILTANDVEYTYAVEFAESKARFVSLQDWDQDGQADDLYDGWQKRIK